MNELNASVDELTAALNDANNSLKQLMDDRMQLEREISNKVRLENCVLLEAGGYACVNSTAVSTMRLHRNGVCLFDVGGYCNLITVGCAAYCGFLQSKF